MAHFARVSRDALYSPTVTIKSPPTPDPTTGDLAWQQKEDFPRPKKSRRHHQWQRFELYSDTPPDNTTIAGENNSAEQQAIVSIVDPGRDARGAPPTSSTLNAPSLLNSSTPHSTSNNHNEKPEQDSAAKHRKRAHKRKPKASMVSQRAYIPPHLRKKTDGAKRVESSPVANGTNGTHGTKVPVKSSVQVTQQHNAAGTDSSNGTKSQAASRAPAQSSPNAANRTSKSPPSPPTPIEKEEGNGWAGWDPPKPEPPPPAPKKINSRWPTREPARKWPKARDMKPLPSEESDGGGVSFHSNSNGDPDYDVKKLIAWNGDWLPPPETWAARRGFTDRHFGASIEKWINGHDKSCIVDLSDYMIPGHHTADFIGKEVDVVVDGKVVGTKLMNKEIAPRTWIPVKIEGDAPHHFWRALPSRAPHPLDEGDLDQSRPFWEAYLECNDDCFLSLPEAPTTILDENDPENAHQGVKFSAEDLVYNKKKNKERRERKIIEKRNRPLPPSLWPSAPAPDHRLKPTANIYLRPVVAADTKGIMDLYNYYVANTISAPEFNPRSHSHIAERIDNITSEGLPYIVAVAKSNKMRPQTQDYVSERIVGFAYIDDYCDKGSSFRYTFELEFFVHPGFLRQGVAKCLLDRLLEMINTSYPAKGGYEWINRGEYLKHGSQRVVKMANVSVPHAAEDDMTWMRKFLKKFHFAQVGHLRKMGYKKDKVIDISIYQHETSEPIALNVPPREPL